MQLSRLKLGLLIGAPVLLIIACVTGYFVYHMISAQQAENRKKVEGFGELVIPLDTTTPQATDDPSLNPSIAQDAMTPVEKVISTLKEERFKLLNEAEVMREQITTLQAKVDELELYKRTNERYAPHTFDEEVSTIHTRMKQFLASQEESKRFNSNQLKGMAAASAQEYRRYLTMNKLLLDQDQIDDVVNHHLPVFAYCIGDGMDIAANNRAEELQVLEYFKTEKTDLMSSRLKSDLKAVLEPCQELFAERMSSFSN
ncbi:hypothetical protein SAMN03080615_03589 [Amphritea atlantica]|jgi:hypothetical protein|uniref:Uncharacterized protein n=1 Tax=Amphritea atlantica TaxID=355243 RepID=A0A1H9KPX2_9GAMM|nr:hypothetical protein [Amphritea atlantica]SER01162.1 hypothetical protein SAMN03080615_03589 [Amphritea atlantica]